VELKLEGISFNRRGKTVLEGINATLTDSGLTCLMGINGTGKTTLLRILSGELKASSGRYFIEGKDAVALSRKEISRYFSVIPQNAPVPPYITVGEMVGLGRFRPRSALWWQLTTADRVVVNECLARCLVTSFKDRRMDELSGGEQRRAWLAFGLAPDKNFLILDETLDGLDLPAKRAFFQMLKGIASKNRGILMASHDLDMVAEFADRVIILSEGRVIFEGAPDPNLSRFISAPDGGYPIDMSCI
jgi:ABC-type cobalamin/Fe3+-siderophores transport system ATPase subunit